MKRIRLTIHPQSLDTPALYRYLTESPDIDAVETVNWNVRTPPAGFLLRVRGDLGALRERLAADPEVTEHAVFPVADRDGYCVIEGRAPTESRALWEHFTRGSLMTVPPVEWNDDGSSTVTLVGTESDVQALVDGVPGDIRVDAERVGSGRIDRRTALDRLTDRQREAVAAAVDLGYYDTPRSATVADVATELDRAISTVGEHLQRAEAKVMTRLFE